MDLNGVGGYFRWTNLGWRDVLALAQQHGWVPTGTDPPEGVAPEQWASGTYYSNDGQLVNGDDANRLADALDRAIDASLADQQLSAQQVQAIQRFVAYCRAGSFRLF